MSTTISDLNDAMLNRQADRIKELESKLTSRDAEIAELKAELYAISVALDDPRTDLTLTMVEVIQAQKKERDLHRNRLASLLFSDYFKPEVTAGMIQELADEYINALAERDQLHEQVKMLRDAVIECLSSGKSKGPEPHGISLKAIDLAEEVLAATKPRSTK